MLSLSWNRQSVTLELPWTERERWNECCRNTRNLHHAVLMHNMIIPHQPSYFTGSPTKYSRFRSSGAIVTSFALSGRHTSCTLTRYIKPNIQCIFGTLYTCFVSIISPGTETSLDVSVFSQEKLSVRVPPETFPCKTSVAEKYTKKHEWWTLPNVTI